MPSEESITIIVSPNSNQPMYLQIEEAIRGALREGELSPGEELPSIRRLAQDLRVSVITTKRAYEDLEREGLVVSVPGRGSFVAESGDLRARERSMAELRERLGGIIAEARRLGMERADVLELIERIFREEKT